MIPRTVPTRFRPFSTLRLRLRNLPHYRRTHLALALTAALAAWVLTGSLLVGDALEATLQRRAFERLGHARAALLAGEHFFPAALANEVSEGSTPVLLLPGSVGQPELRTGAPLAQVLGVDFTFWQISPSSPAITPEGPQAALNRRAAELLRARVGSVLDVRLARPVPPGAAPAGAEPACVTLRLTVAALIEPGEGGDFALRAGAQPPANVFVPRAVLEDALGLREQANLLLSTDRTAAALQDEVEADWPKVTAGGTSPDPALEYVDLQESARQAARPPVPWGGLVLGLSAGLLAAPLLLSALLFAFLAEQRREEAEVLVRLGWRPGQARRLLLGEGAVLAGAGSLLGAALASGYTLLLLRVLAAGWPGVAREVSFFLPGAWLTYGVGAVGGSLLACAAQAVGSRLPSGPAQVSAEEAPSRGGWGLAGGAAGGAVVLLAAFPHSPRLLFLSGFLVLLSGLGLSSRLLSRSGGPEAEEAFSLAGLARRQRAAHRRGALAIMALLGGGLFLVLGAEAFRLRVPGADRHEGTGGFAWVGESALPLAEDLQSPAGCAQLGLPPATAGAIVPFCVREGDEASSLNLHRPAQPRLLGVEPAALAARGAFRFREHGGSWEVLNAPGEAIPAVVDAQTLRWSLRARVGDTLTYRDEQGASFPVRIAGTLESSLLQGSLVIARERFREKFPALRQPRSLLLEPLPAGADLLPVVRALEGRGFGMEPAARRLAHFQQAENLFLTTFQVLSSVGLVLGSTGLAVVIARRARAQRGEQALLRAVGFRGRQLRQLVRAEYRLLLLLGAGVGLAGALAVLWPGLRHPEEMPWAPAALGLGLLLATAAGAIGLGALFSRRRQPLRALRAE